MKKIFTFAIALVSMAAVMTSCNNDEAEFIEQSTPTRTIVENEDMKDIYLLVAVTPEQKNYYDELYTIQTQVQTHNIMVSEMAPATQDQIAAFSQTNEMAKAFNEMEEPAELEYYSIKLSQTNSGSSVRILSHELMIKDNHPTEQFNYISAACIYFNGQIVRNNTKLDIRYFNGTYGDDDNLKGFANVLNQFK